MDSVPEPETSSPSVEPPALRFNPIELLEVSADDVVASLVEVVTSVGKEEASEAPPATREAPVSGVERTT